MKIILASGIACLSLSSLNTISAQPTLTSFNSNPQPGESFASFFSDTTGVHQGNGGIGVTWDFSLLSYVPSDTIRMKNCTGSAGCASFPGSNITDRFYYYAVSADSFVYYGRLWVSDSLVYTNPQVLLKYPFTYNSMFLDSSSGTNSSPSLQFIATDTVICDGYGTLMLPGHTYSNVIRVLDVNRFYDSTGPAENNYMETRTYNWYSPGIHHSLLTISYIANGVVFVGYTGPLSYYKLIWFYQDITPTEVHTIEPGLSSIQIFPNPAKDVVTISFSMSETASMHISLLDITGKKIATIADKVFSKGTQNINFDTSPIPQGVYIVKVYSQGDIITRKLAKY